MRIRAFVIAILLGGVASTASAGDSAPASSSSKEGAPEISCTLVECHTAAEWAAIKKREAKKHTTEKDTSPSKQASASGD